MENTVKTLPEIGYHNDVYEACDGADAVVIVTEWNEFRNLDLERVMRLLKQPHFFDLRNIYAPQKMATLGFRYHSVGRVAQTYPGLSTGSTEIRGQRDVEQREV
jgi:UDPglucose 6-dehydrogenase